MAEPCSIVPADSIQLTIDPDGTWPYAEANRVAASNHFMDLRGENPTLFNGPVYMLTEHRHDGRVVRGRAVRSDYASFLHWRHKGFPDSSVRNTFGVAAMHGSDGALILGVMAHQTSNAGKIYPPSGSFDDSDVVDDALDVAGNIRREVAEETGLDLGSARPGEWLVIDDGPRLAFMRRFDWPVPTTDLVRRIETELGRQVRPELAGVHVVTGLGDIVPSRMPPFTAAYIEHVFG